MTYPYNINPLCADKKQNKHPCFLYSSLESSTLSIYLLLTPSQTPFRILPMYILLFLTTKISFIYLNFVNFQKFRKQNRKTRTIITFFLTF